MIISVHWETRYSFLTKDMEDEAIKQLLKLE